MSSFPRFASARLAAICLVVAHLPTIASPGRAKVESATEHGFLVTNEETVPVAPASAWEALVHDIDRWWPKDHTWWGEESQLSIEPVAGGCFCEIAGPRQALHMTVTFVEPGEVLRLVGGLGPLQGMGLHGALEFRLEPAGDGTRITLRYQVGGYAPDDLSQLAPIVDRVQGLQLGGLADYLREAAAEDETSRPEAEGSGTP